MGDDNNSQARDKGLEMKKKHTMSHVVIDQLHRKVNANENDGSFIRSLGYD